MAKILKEPKNILLRRLLQSEPEDLESLSLMAANAQKVLNEIKEQVLEPYPRKAAPTFSTSQVAALCGKTRVQLKNAEASANIKLGELRDGDISKTYTLEDTIAAVKHFGNGVVRQPGQKAKVLVIANYKGGVGKTTASVSIAQGLALRNVRTLLIDNDPQGSATTLFGLSPQFEVDDDQTVAPFIFNDEPDLRYAVRQTYWSNLDLIAGSSSVLGAEVAMPRLEEKIPGYQSWNRLMVGLEPLKDEYDVIIVDTGPNLGSLTQNAVIAADAILCPCPLDALDFASLVQFWGLFLELVGFFGKNLITKRFDFVGIFVSKAKLEKDEFATSNIIKGWLKRAFGEKLWDITLPESGLVKTAASLLQTIYDISDKKEMEKQSYKRYKEPMDDLVDSIISRFNFVRGNQ